MEHLTLVTRRRRTLAPAQALLPVVRTVDRVVGARALLFCVVDDHIHLVLRGTSAEIGRSGRALRLALRSLRPAAPLEPAHRKPVQGRDHLASLLGYLLEQPSKHGVGSDPLWPGSCFLDLVGARSLRRFDRLALWEELPRLRTPEVLDAVGLGELPPFHPPSPGLALVAAEQSCATALSAGPRKGWRPRCVAVHLLDGVGVSTRRQAELLQVSPRAIRRARATTPSELEAARRYLRVQQAVVRSRGATA